MATQELLKQTSWSQAEYVVSEINNVFALKWRVCRKEQWTASYCYVCCHEQIPLLRKVKPSLIFKHKEIFWNNGWIAVFFSCCHHFHILSLYKFQSCFSICLVDSSSTFLARSDNACLQLGWQNTEPHMQCKSRAYANHWVASLRPSPERQWNFPHLCHG